MKRALLGLLAMTAVALAPAQEITVAGLLSDESKATLKVGDLTPTHRAFKVTMAGGGGGGFMDMVMGMFRGFGAALGGASAGEQSKEQEVGAKLLTAIDLFWTEGQTVKMSGKEFLVAYRYELELSAMQASGPPKLGPDTKMNLTLINMENVATISPRPEMTREAFWKVLKDAAELPAPAPPEPGTATPTAPMEPGEMLPAPMPDESNEDVKRGMEGAKSVAVAMLMYTSDWDDQIPYVQSTGSAKAVTLPYVKDASAWKTHNPEGSRFLFNMKLAGALLSEIGAPNTVPMYVESKAWPDGRRIVAFVDGSVRMVKADEWAMVEAGLFESFRRVGKPLPPDYMIDWLRQQGIDPNG